MTTMIKCHMCFEPYPISEQIAGRLAGPCCREPEKKGGLVIRFDGPPEHVAGRFVEVELDGKGIKLGEWKKDGKYWLLVLPEAIAEIARRTS